MFPAAGPVFFDVGARIGPQLRKAREESDRDAETGRSVRPHLRRGHHHGFWIGPRDGDRTLVYRWLPPLLVGRQPDGGEDGDGNVDPARPSA